MRSPAQKIMEGEQVPFSVYGLFWAIGFVGCMMIPGLSRPSALAAESTAIVTEYTRASLVSDHDSLPADHHLRLGLHLALKPGWHTYWLNPGDAGEAPSMTSQIYQQISSSAPGQLVAEGKEFLWPVPERLSEGGLMAYAYQGDVLLPQKLVFADSVTSVDGGTAHIKAHADWLVCATVCVPEQGSFTLDLPVSPVAPVGDDQVGVKHAGNIPESKEAILFHRADAAMPVPSSFTTRLLKTGTDLQADREGLLVISGRDIMPQTVSHAWFMPEKGGIIQQNEMQKFEVKAGEMTLSLLADRSAKSPYWQKAFSGVLVMEAPSGARRAVHMTVPPAQLLPNQSLAAVSAPPVGPVPGIIPGALPGSAEMGKSVMPVALSSAWHYLFFAFLGGMILNLMPCVFPVLAMKAFSLVRLGHGHRGRQIASAGFYTLGVMGSFLILGGLLISLRIIGPAIGIENIGWGFQFQSPYFVVMLCWLLFVMALNLLGVFQITGGRLVNTLSNARMVNEAQNAPDSAPHYWGDILTGLLAVIVATPCTAPFMGVAIAGALSGPVLLGLAVFLAMGLGLALPYVLIALVPGLAARLPRPGAWMEVLKQFLAFPLLATCVWLLWVAGQQRGIDFAALVVGGVVLLGMAAWFYGLVQARQMRGQRTVFCWIGLICCLGFAFAGLFLFEGDHSSMSARQTEKQQGDGLIERFSPERLASLRQNGTPVFVDMTASWCLTCMVNERVALRNSAVQAEFRKRHLIILRGDWTNKDATITAWLNSQGRDGVPLYVYYPPGGKGRQLPQILTPGIVLKAIRGG